MKWLLSVLILTLASCADTRFLDESNLSKKALILGMVYDMDRKPVPGVRVTVDDYRGSVETDVRGHFGIGPIEFGQRTVRYSKEGYEPAAVSFRYSEATQNVYIQLASRDQLFEAAMDAWEGERYSEAWAYVDRAEAFGGVSATSIFIRSAIDARRSKPDAAVARIDEFLRTHPDQPSLELLLADVWQKQLHNPAKALEALKKAQALRDDATTRQRIATLADDKNP